MSWELTLLSFQTFLNSRRLHAGPLLLGNFTGAAAAMSTSPGEVQCAGSLLESGLARLKLCSQHSSSAFWWGLHLSTSLPDRHGIFSARYYLRVVILAAPE